MRSPLQWIGGKTYLADWLKSMFPPHYCYIEVFAGGASVLFSKQRSGSEILNDLSDNLVLFYTIIKDDEKRKKLIKILDSFTYSRKLFTDFSNSYRDGSLFKLDDLNRIARWYFLNRASFSGLFGKGMGTSPIRNKSGLFRNSIDYLDVVAKRLKNVFIDKLDYSLCIERFDEEDSFFYIDPPYLGTESYYHDSEGKDCSFDKKDHKKLALVLKNIRGKAMVSYYDSEFCDSLYKGWWRGEKEVAKSSSSLSVKSKGMEVVYCNYTPEISKFKMNKLF